MFTQSLILAAGIALAITPLATAEKSKNPAHGEEGHQHGPECAHGHEAERPDLDQAAVRKFLVKHLPYAVAEFDDMMKTDEKAEIPWILKDYTSVINEHEALLNYDPKLAETFRSVHKNNFDLHIAIRNRLTAGDNAEAAAKATKPQLKKLIASRLKLEIGNVSYAKWKLDQDLKALKDAEKNIDKLLEEELSQVTQKIKAELEADKPEKKEK